MNAVQEQVIRSKVKESMNTALNEARNRGGKWWDTAAKIANTQGMEQLYAQQVIDAANVGFVTITEGVDAAFNLRLSQIACAGLSTALMGYITTAWPPFGIISFGADVVNFVASLFSGPRDNTHLYNEIKDQMAAECESHLQTQYINLHIIWLLYRSINGLEPNAGTTSAFNTSPSFTFDEVFWHELRKAGFYDYHSHGGEKKQIIFEKDSVWSNWIKWPKDPDEEDMNQYVTMMKEGYSAFRIVPLNNATDSILNTLTNSIRMDLKVKEEGFIPLLNDLYWQRNWRWCKKCQSLFYAGNSNGVCPAGDKGHDGSGSSNYLLNYNEPNATGQHKWRWCKKCQTLYYAGGPLVTSTKSPLHQCPAGGSHDGSQSGDYIMHKKIEAWGVSCQSHWRWCKKCQTLYYAGGPLITSSTPLHQCPMGGSHDGSQSGHYELRMGSDEKQEMPR